jgi:uncharacterized protein with von Willebrand factor type A (vWA) domain
VYCREPLTHSATVILLDMRASMELFDRHRFTAAKQVALALSHLMGAHFPRDALHIVGFGDTARPIPLYELPYVTNAREHTNSETLRPSLSSSAWCRTPTLWWKTTALV